MFEPIKIKEVVFGLKTAIRQNVIILSKDNVIDKN